LSGHATGCNHGKSYTNTISLYTGGNGDGVAKWTDGCVGVDWLMWFQGQRHYNADMDASVSQF